MALNTLNSVGGFSVGEAGANVILANGDVTTGNLLVSSNNGIVNFASTANVTLGSVSNLHISGGTAEYVLSTNGSGSLAWIAQAGSQTPSNIANGTSNVKIATSGGNVTTSVGGNANIIVVTGTGANISGYANITGNVQAGNITATGNISGNYILGNGTYLTGVDASTAVTAGTVTSNAQPNITSVGTLTSLSVTGNVTNGNLDVSGTLSVDYITSHSTDANISLAPNGNGIVTIVAVDGGSTGIQLGTPTAGALVSNAVTLTTATSVTNGIAQLNLVLGKLIPASPPNFPGGTSISITTATTSARMCGGFTQPDNTPGANKAVAAGTLVSTVRSSSYTTNTISNTGPGDSGIITAYLNGASAGNVAFNPSATPTANGVYSNLVVTNNYDYHTANSSIAAGFWYVFSASAAGTITSGWNEIYIGDSVTGNTNTANWYYDSSSALAPVFSSVTVTASASPTLAYSSTIPHYASGTTFGLGFNVNRLSANTYPNNGNLLTNSTAAGGAFQAPVSISYASASITVPLAQNLYVSSGNATATTTTAIVSSGFGSSSVGPSVTVTNGYNSTTQTFTTALANTVLYKNGNSVAIDEGNIVIGSTIGAGTGNAYRIISPGEGNTPVFTGTEANFNSQSSTLNSYDATVVGVTTAGVMMHDQTNYSTGYLPAGPNLALNGNRTGTQYFTFKFIRTAASKFDIRYTGNVAGMWVALPGSVIDSSSSANGWVNMSAAYGGAGYPGVNSPGNGSDGCAVGGAVVLNTLASNVSKTCTFGTVSSSSTALNEIYVRIALSAGQTVTALTLQTASN